MTRTVEFVIDVWPCGNNPRVWMRRFLRRLVREAVIESWRTTIDAEPSYKDAGALEDNVRFEANRIAKELVR